MDFSNLFVARIENLFTTLCEINSNPDYLFSKDLNCSKILKFLSFENLKLMTSNKLIVTKKDDICTIEKFDLLDNSKYNLSKGVLQLFLNLPLAIYSQNSLKELLKSEVEKISCNQITEEKDYLINKGKKAVFKLNKNTENNQNEVNNIHHEKWCNVILAENHKKIIMTAHKDITVDRENRRLVFHYKVCEFNLNLDIYIESNQNNFFHIYTKLEYLSETGNRIFTELKFSMNKNDKFHEIYCFDKIDDKSVTGQIVDKMLDLKKRRIDKHFTKKETSYDYSENSGEWYETEENNDHSYGNKYYSNSNKRNFTEDWWKWERENFFELKVNRNLEDGLGTKTYEHFGHRDEGGKRVFEFVNQTVDVVHSGEVTTKKKGFDQNGSWNSKIIKVTPNESNKNKAEINHVENWGKNFRKNEEWFEKWYESYDQKNCYKRGNNGNSEWEEEWNELNFFESNRVEKNCYKKCQVFESKQKWFETWSENYCFNENMVYKTCHKTNENWMTGVKHKENWTDAQPIN